ncbi:cupin domain-containing protein [Planococcus lenghuensis]|uniref:Cupin type-2 domain-containing protein n=1 Tax=Planococcus lenghuensis TaxID=2213202 RepID=A0A1Q2L1Z5_9BACL|nr:cupin domain-containing protein [Planococcus lenghuensis]AQQ54478.1 hypothetical protein B0X71_16130 [Planococcus lenghuensis]
MKVIETPSYLDELPKHTSTVLEFAKTNVLNIQLKAGESIPEHKSDADVLIVVRRGAVTFTVGGETVELTAGKLLLLEPGELHDLLAQEDTDLLAVQIGR